MTPCPASQPVRAALQCIPHRDAPTAAAPRLRRSADAVVNGWVVPWRPADGIKYTVYDKQDNFSSTIARKLEVTVQMPWYLNQDTPGSSVRLVLDAQGLPVYQGLVPVNFTLLVPKSLVQNRTKGPVLQYGHGLFGSRSEVQEGYVAALCRDVAQGLSTGW